MRSVALLGSTGSIGRQAIQVCDDDPELRVCALAAGSDAEGVVREAERLGVGTIALADPAAAAVARARFSGRVLEGKSASASGVVAHGNRLVVRLTRAAPDFPSRLL